MSYRVTCTRLNINSVRARALEAEVRKTVIWGQAQQPVNVFIFQMTLSHFSVGLWGLLVIQHVCLAARNFVNISAQRLSEDTNITDSRLPDYQGAAEIRSMYRPLRLRGAECIMEPELWRSRPFGMNNGPKNNWSFRPLVDQRLRY